LWNCITHVLRDRRYPPQQEAPNAQAHQFFSCYHDGGLSYGFLGYIRCGHTKAEIVAKGWVMSSISPPHLPAQILAPIFDRSAGRKLARDRRIPATYGRAVPRPVF
jgi:hypothetical protein